MYVSINVKAFLIVHLTNCIHVSTCPLLWWWCDEVINCWMFICLKMQKNVSHDRFLPTSEIISFGSPNSVKISLFVCTRLSAERLLTYHHYWKFAVAIYNAKNFYYKSQIYLHQLLSKVCLVFHNVMPFP